MTNTEIGSTITTVAQVEVLPVGTVIDRPNADGNMLIRTLTGWISSGGDVILDQHIALNRYTLIKVGTPTEDTATRFLQRFRTVAIGAAFRHNVRVEPVRQAIEALRIPNIDLCVGAVLHPRDVDQMDSIPAGVVGAVGDPDHWSHYGIWHHTGAGRWAWLTGGLTTLYEPMTIISWPGQTEPAEWVTADATEEDQTAIASFKVRMWDLGLKAKSVQQWCGAYENTMMSLGIDSRVGMVPTPLADPKTWDQVMALSDGAIIRVTGEHTTADHFIARKQGGEFVRISGPREFVPQDNVEVLWDGVGQSNRIPVTEASVIAALPVGSMIEQSGTRYVKQMSLLWDRETGGGGHADTAFGSPMVNNTHIVRFGPEVVSFNNLTIGSVVTDVETMNTLPLNTTVQQSGNQFVRGAEFWSSIDGHGPNIQSGDFDFDLDSNITIVEFDRTQVRLAQMRVGSVIRSGEEMDALPIGAQVFASRTSNWWQKVSDTSWQHEARGRIVERTAFGFSDDRVTIRSMGAEPDEPAESTTQVYHPIGYRFRTMEEIRALPIGSVMGSRSGDNIKIMDGGWVRDNRLIQDSTWSVPTDFTLISPPMQHESGHSVGEVVRWADREVVPVGATIMKIEDTTKSYLRESPANWQRLGTGWANYETRSRADNMAQCTGYYIVSLPAVTVGDESIPVTFDSDGEAILDAQPEGARLFYEGQYVEWGPFVKRGDEWTRGHGHMTSSMLISASDRFSNLRIGSE